MQSHQNEQAIIEAIQGNEAARDSALSSFFNNQQLFLTIQKHITLHGGNASDADDVFQETLIIFDRNIRLGKFEGKSSLNTYFVAIAKWYWLGQQRKKTMLPLDNIQEKESSISVETEYMDTEKRDLLNKIVGKIGQRCQTLLKYYKLSYSMEEVATLYGLSSAAMAKKETYRCREKLRNYIQENPKLITLLQ